MSDSLSLLDEFSAHRALTDAITQAGDKLTDEIIRAGVAEFERCLYPTVTPTDLDRLAEFSACPGSPHRRIFDAEGREAPAEVYLDFLNFQHIPTGYRLETDADLRARMVLP